LHDKPSEFTEATSELRSRSSPSIYDEDEVVRDHRRVRKVGAEFTKKLAFDHILFNRCEHRWAARDCAPPADNLVPLHSGKSAAKSPVILGRSATCRRRQSHHAGKTLKAGQICLAPD